MRLDVLLLLFLRVSALFFSTQIFGRTNVPNMVKIGLCAILTYFFFVEAVPAGYAIAYDNTIVYVMLCLKELLFGLILGYVTNLFVTLTFTAGQMIDMQMGFGMVNILDVQSNISVPMVGNFLNMSLLLVFFSVGGHLRLIQMLGSTVERIPLGSVSLSVGDFAMLGAELFSKAFLLGVNIALPIVAAGLLGEIAMGIIIRSVPQLNVFSIGLPVKVIIGFSMLLFTIPIFGSYLTSTVFSEMYLGLDKMFAALAG